MSIECLWCQVIREFVLSNDYLVLSTSREEISLISMYILLLRLTKTESLSSHSDISCGVVNTKKTFGQSSKWHDKDEKKEGNWTSASKSGFYEIHLVIPANLCSTLLLTIKNNTLELAACQEISSLRFILFQYYSTVTTNNFWSWFILTCY